MTFPVINDNVESGKVYGLQTKVSLSKFFSIGARYQVSQFGSPEQTFFEGTANEFTSEKDGGDVASYAFDVYLGNASGTPGLNVYLMGSVGNFTWQRDYTSDVTELSYSGGVGLEVVIPAGLGLETRGMFEVIPKDGGNDGSWKNLLWFVGANFHFGGQ
jgi:hypothetical protein